MKHIYLKLIILFGFAGSFTSIASAQKPVSSFDSTYVHAATTLAALDIHKAIQVADSLYKHAQNSVHEMKALMLVATLKGHVGSVVDALSYAIKAEEIAQTDKNHEWQVRIAGFLSTTFREVNLTEEGKKYLLIAKKANEKTKSDSPSAPVIKAFIHQETAFYQIEDEDYHAAIEEIGKAEIEISQTPEALRNRVFLATNYQLLGICYQGLENSEKARESYQLALDALGDQESELRAFVYKGIGEIEMHEGNYEAALEYFQKAEAYVESSERFSLKSGVYKNLSTYFKAINKQEEASRYNELYLEIVKSQFNSTKSISNQLIKQLHIDQKKSLYRNSFLFGASLFLVGVIFLLVLRFWLLRKKERKQYEEIIRKIKTSESLMGSDEAAIKQIIPLDPEKSAESSMMPKETEERILNELEQWERDTSFLNKELSLSSLATELHTNPKYLSYVINTHKGKDFNNYVNELKILFIIDKLRDNPEYLEYKLSYIADEFGFSSHSKFTSVFKSVVGLSPSIFISHLKKDRLEIQEAD